MSIFLTSASALITIGGSIHCVLGAYRGDRGQETLGIVWLILAVVLLK